ncbi:Tyramine/octopamine receptor [Schistosoma mansoni]|uniref:Tyramine/octopamine receptor n=1 Tax=Schistosoma mansoni TaxID=6183 RepID=G4VI72_SCHMA|nr:Tyramine/octopamine receptor [Schistosoma mansoni]|eukprot:XP_018651729.1 Tyramine/octopamine receptor [Schistosoma mansoni]
MNHLFSSNNTFPENEYRMEACHENISYGLFSTNSNFINDLVNLTKVESEMFSEWRFALNIIIISLQILSGIFIFCGNLLVISAVATTKVLRRITDLYIVSLALSDLLVAVLILPLSIMRQVYGHWPYESHELCTYWISLNLFLCSASTFNICCISVDRYIAINYPMKYISKRTRSTAFAMIGGAWIASFLIMIPPIFGSQHHTGVGSCYARSDARYRFIIAISTFFVPSLLVGFIYIRIFWVIRRRSKEFKFGNFSSNPKEHRFGSFKLLFNTNNIYNQSFGHKMNRFSLHNSSQRQLFVTNSTQSNLFIAYTPRIKHKNTEEYTVNQSHVQSTSTSCFNKRSEQIEQMVSIPMFHGKTKSDPNDFSSFPIHSNTENTEIHALQTTGTIDKTVDASMNDRQKDQQREDEHRINSQNRRIVNSKPKHSSTRSVIYQRRKLLVYNSEKKTVKTVALVVCCFVLCWLPFTTLYLMEGVCECLYSEAIFMATTWIGYLNSMCNPFIYAFCNAKCAKAFKRLLHIGSNS